MTFHALRAAPALAVLTLAAFPARADVITTVDGQALRGVTVVDQSVTEVLYRAEGKSGEKTIPAHEVMEIEFARKPPKVDEADEMLRDGQVGDALGLLQDYIKEVTEDEKRERYKWAPAYAMHRVLEIYAGAGDPQGTIKAADTVIEKASGSRYVPLAYLAKADALAVAGQADKAEKALLELKGKAEEGGWSKRWVLAADLALTLIEPGLSEAKRRDRVVEIGAAAGNDFPTVRNRARVAEGESYLIGDKPDYAKAQESFEKITADPAADEPTLAGAYAGLGECLFHAGVEKINQKSSASDVLQRSLLAFLRAASYEDQARYRPKALFYAGRVFDFLEDETSKQRARQMYRALIGEYPNSPWAAEAQKFL